MMRSLTCLSLLALAACEPVSAAPAAPVPAGPLPLAVTSVVTQPLAKAMRLPGELQATRDVAIHARVQGFVEKIEVDRGSAVKQGQLLVQLVAPEMQATCAEAMAKLASSVAS
jgi:multidrug efflux pump subunit AcrA (membrane-fusion protein)